MILMVCMITLVHLPCSWMCCWSRSSNILHSLSPTVFFIIKQVLHSVTIFKKHSTKYKIKKMCFVISNAYRSFPGSYSLFLKSGEEDIFVVTSVPKVIAIFLKVMVININFRTKMIWQIHSLTNMLLQSSQEFSSTNYVKVCIFYNGSLCSTLAYTYCDLIPLSAASCFHSFNHISNRGFGILVLFFFLFPYNVPSSSMLL